MAYSEAKIQYRRRERARAAELMADGKTAEEARYIFNRELWDNGEADLVDKYAPYKLLMQIKAEDEASGAQDEVEPVKGDVVIDDRPRDLPDWFAGRVDDTISAYCSKYKIDDLRKADAGQWRSLCTLIGWEIVRKSKMTIDTKRQREVGGTPRNPYMLEQLLYYWAYLCGVYSKPPLARDFYEFADVSDAYLYDYGDKLTSSEVELKQKATAIQEAGLTGILADGRKNPTGSIFLLKNWHGYRDERTIERIDAPSRLTADKLPKFD